MKKIKALALGALLFSAVLANAHAALPGLKETVVVVDKKTHQLHLTNYNDGKLDIVQTFRATMGQKVGDKLFEGDLKTPEGIYDFLFLKRPPQLGKKFGPLAIYVNYPNSMDKSGAKTGFDIMVHGTDDPARLEKQYDSLGCVVLDNENVKIVSENVEMKQTKIVITKDFSKLQGTPRIERAKAFFDKWLKAWSGKDITTYVESYADEYRMDGMNRVAFMKYKDALNKKYDTINVTAADVRFYFHEKYDLVTFTQHYSSTFAGGVPAFNGTSKKNLYLQERNGEYRIVMEESPK
ncbi:MAG: murein L,D-transpeptidase family protein [Bacteriovoracia bacterium]